MKNFTIIKQKYTSFILISVCFCLISCFSVRIGEKSSTLTSQDYVKNNAAYLQVSKASFYYVSKESSANFIDNMQPSLISFVKGNTSTSIDEIMVDENGNGNLKPLNSCSNFDFTTAEDIKKYLNNNKSYEGLVLKSIENKSTYSFPEDEITAVILYSSKMKNFMSKYLMFLNHLRDNENIPYVFVTMDLEEIKAIPDAYQKAIIN